MYSYLTNKEHKVIPHKKVQKKKLYFYDEVQSKVSSQLKGKFTSAYANYNNLKHPDFTAYSKDCKHPIDYIMFTEQF